MGHAADCGAQYALQSVLRVYNVSISKHKRSGSYTMGTLKDGTYNGWTNYATWRVNLEIFDGINPRDMGWNGLDKYDLATVLKDYVEEILESEQAPQRRAQSMPLAYGYALAFLSDVNYREIAGMMLSEYADEGETETEDA